MLVHADVDAFFAAVEQRDDPSLAGRPFVVAAGVIACASYPARAMGVHAGMSMTEAVRRWPDLAVVPPRGDAYVAASEELFALFGRHARRVEPGSMEEAFLAMPDVADPTAAAVELRLAVRRELGLPISVGVGTTKMMAKMASRRAKPGGIVVIDAAEDARLRPTLRLAEIWGIGAPTAAKLRDAGLVSVRDLVGYSVAGLTRIVSVGMARRLVAIALGTDDATVRPPGRRRSVGAQRTISPSTTDPARLRAVSEELVSSVLARLAGDPRRPTRVEVSVWFGDGSVGTERSDVPAGEPLPTALAATVSRSLPVAATFAPGQLVFRLGIALRLPTARTVTGQLELPMEFDQP